MFSLVKFNLFSSCFWGKILNEEKIKRGKKSNQFNLFISCFWGKILNEKKSKEEFFFEVSRKIYSNSEKSEQFLKQNPFLTCSWRFLRSNILEQLEFQIRNNNLDLEKLTGNVRKHFFNFLLTIRRFMKQISQFWQKKKIEKQVYLDGTCCVLSKLT